MVCVIHNFNYQIFLPSRDLEAKKMYLLKMLTKLHSVIKEYNQSIQQTFTNETSKNLKCKKQEMKCKNILKQLN